MVGVNNLSSIMVYAGLWILLVVIPAILSQYYLIEKKKIYPNKTIWFMIRLIVAIVFLSIFIYEGFVWYKALGYMVFSFWWPFNTGLNLLRGRYFSNLAPKNDFIDWLLIKITGGDVTAKSNSGKNLMREMLISFIGLLAFIYVMSMVYLIN